MRGFPAALATLLTSLVLLGAGPGQVTTEAELEAAMREIRPDVLDLKRHLDAQQGGDADRVARQLAALFRTVEQFWIERGKDDAVGWARQAVALAEETAEATRTRRFAPALELHAALRAVCRSCHTAYRERDADGNYRLKR